MDTRTTLITRTKNLSFSAIAGASELRADLKVQNVDGPQDNKPDRRDPLIVCIDASAKRQPAGQRRLGEVKDNREREVTNASGQERHAPSAKRQARHCTPHARPRRQAGPPTMRPALCRGCALAGLPFVPQPDEVANELLRILPRSSGRRPVQPLWSPRLSPGYRANFCLRAISSAALSSAAGSALDSHPGSRGQRAWHRSTN